MRFECELPDSPAMWALRSAGIDADGLFDLWHGTFTHRKKTTLPAIVNGEYFRSDPPRKVRLKVLAFDPHTHIGIDVASPSAARHIRRVLRRYSVQNNGQAVAQREHRALWKQINTILARDRLTYDKLRHGGVLTRRAIKSLMQLCQRIDPIQWHDIYRLFDQHSVPRPERLFTVQWLIRLFEKERDPDEEIGIPIYELVVPQVAEDLIRLIRDKRYRDRRWPLALALAKTRHPRAADVIVTLLPQGHNTRGALEALGKLPAHKHVDTIRRYLRHTNADVRHEAQKTLKKLKRSRGG
jgi:hypothetical protein